MLSQSLIPRKRISKVAIYAAHGIEYRNGKIKSPVYGWIAPLAVKGNKKIGKVWHFSTLPTDGEFIVEINGEPVTVKGTCNGTCKNCYACTGNYRFQSVRRALAIRTILARLFPDFVKRALTAQIIADCIELFRIHASGDFFSAEYVEMWQEIATTFPACKFWTYTKNQKAETAFDNIQNANIVRSILPCGGFNFGKAGEMLKAYESLKTAGESVYICKCGIDKNQHCDNCKGCATHKYVLFLLHGDPTYKPENDADFPRFVSVVSAQAEN